MKNEGDGWTTNGANILAPDILRTLEQTLAQQAIILEHRFYQGSRSPSRLVFDDYDELLDYLKSNAQPGDHFWMWGYSELCRDDNSLVRGKYPDSAGRTPSGGAY